MKKIILLLCLVCSVGLSQTYVLTRSGGILVKIPAAWISGDSLQVQATATIDSTVWAKLWVVNGKQNVIPNLGDTATYVHYADSTKAGSGWASDWEVQSKIGVAGYSKGDTAAFTTTATRAAIFISGCRDNQIWQATPRIPAATTLPVAGDFLVASPKWDSLVVKRAAGTTSGLKFNYFRIK